MTKKGKEFEELIAAVEEAVHDLPGVQVYHNVKLPTNYGGKRQIDILIEEERGRFKYKTIIECKNTNSKISVNTVGAFKELLESVGAHQGIIVSSSGFQKGALESAKQSNIYLYQLSQISELEHHLKKARFNIYELSHTSKDFTIRFKKKKPINNLLTIHDKLFSPHFKKHVTIVEITQHFLDKIKSSIADSLIRKVTVFEEWQIIQGETTIEIHFTYPIIFTKKSESTELSGFESVLQTQFFTAPVSTKGVSEYKDVVQSKTHALVYDVEFGGEKFKIMKKEV